MALFLIAAPAPAPIPVPALSLSYFWFTVYFPQPFTAPRFVSFQNKEEPSWPKKVEAALVVSESSLF